MGLDQYLYARRYLPCYPHNGPEARSTCESIASLAKLPITESTNSLEVTAQIGYWRKANQVHGWLIRNCAGGDPDQTEFDVSREDLNALLSLCLEVKSSAVLAPARVTNGHTLGPDGRLTPFLEDGMVVENAADILALLPPTPGFFFGSTDIDQWYMADIDHTVEVLRAALSLDDDVEFSYRASW